jgi:hypothetical protein
MTLRLTPAQSLTYDQGSWEGWRLEETLIEDLERQGITEDCVIETDTGAILFTITRGTPHDVLWITNA